MANVSYVRIFYPIEYITDPYNYHTSLFEVMTLRFLLYLDQKHSIDWMLFDFFFSQMKYSFNVKLVLCWHKRPFAVWVCVNTRRGALRHPWTRGHCSSRCLWDRDTGQRPCWVGPGDWSPWAAAPPRPAVQLPDHHASPPTSSCNTWVIMDTTLTTPATTATTTATTSATTTTEMWRKVLKQNPEKFQRRLHGPLGISKNGLWGSISFNAFWNMTRY